MNHIFNKRVSINPYQLKVDFANLFATLRVVRMVDSTGWPGEKRLVRITPFKKPVFLKGAPGPASQKL